jgi:hypothetical protein
MFMATDGPVRRPHACALARERSRLAWAKRDRLLNRAKADNVEFQLMLTRFALERLLYRLSISPHRDQFLLKGALLFDLWFEEPHRPTQDVDQSIRPQAATLTHPRAALTAHSGIPDDSSRC